MKKTETKCETKIKISKNGKLVGKHETSRVVGPSGLEHLELEEPSAGSAVKQSSRKSLKTKETEVRKKATKSKVSKASPNVKQK